MEWTRSETLALASVQCTTCQGMGLRPARRGKGSPCNCVLRAIFRACYRRFRQCVEKEKHLSRCSLEYTGGRDNRCAWSRKDEEYMADFLLMARRELEPEQYRVFSYRYLLGANWRLCTRQLKMEKGAYFHYLYVIEQRLGRAFRETKPYGLYPVEDYFGGGYGESFAPLTPRRGPKPLVPPMDREEADPIAA